MLARSCSVISSWTSNLDREQTSSSVSHWPNLHIWEQNCRWELVLLPKTRDKKNNFQWKNPQCPGPKTVQHVKGVNGKCCFWTFTGLCSSSVNILIPQRKHCPSAHAEVFWLDRHNPYTCSVRHSWLCPLPPKWNSSWILVILTQEGRSTTNA